MKKVFLVHRLSISSNTRALAHSRTRALAHSNKNQIKLQIFPNLNKIISYFIFN